MNEQLLERLDYLAAKLGTTADYLWPKLVQHSFVTGITVVSACTLVSVTSTLIYRAVFKSKDCDEDSKVGLAIILAVVLIFMLLGTVHYVIDIFVPEVAALEKITKLIK